ncbi:sulfate transporter [Streptomyces sp. PT12]|nr:sulfate transporter [Streptomyces sp. PT12]
MSSGRGAGLPWRGALARGPRAWGRRPAVRGQLFVIRGPVARDDVPGICERLSAHVRRGGMGDVTVDVAEVGGANAVALEVVARLRLTAKRLGCGIRFVNMRAGLPGLVGWLGLGEVGLGEVGLGEVGLGEVGGEAEEGEQPCRVEEGVDPDDAPP